MNSDIDKVSIIMPSFNSSPFIGFSINSLINQTYKNWELIVVDDNSSDETFKIISNFSKSDPRITGIRLDHNVGPAEARNIALRKSTGRFIAFLDSDDLWVNVKLEHQLKFMLENNFAFSFSSYEQIYENGRPMGTTIVAPNAITYNEYLKNTIIGCLTVIIDKKYSGYFEMPNIKSSHDMALWLNLLKKLEKAYGIQEVLVYYRVVSTSNTSKKLAAAKDVWRVYRDIESLSIFKSLYNFVFYAGNAIIKRI